MLKKTIAFKLLLFSSLISQTISCSFRGLSGPPEFELKELTTVVPKKFGSIAPKESFKVLNLPHELFSIKGTARSHVEVRSGPGSTFLLEDFVLPYDTAVIVLDEYKVWRKILVLENQKTGWVHHKLLYPQKYEQSVQVSLTPFPYVTARKEIRSLHAFPTLEKKDVLIPKGSSFVVFKQENGYYLVWLAETRSVAWISKTDLM